MRGAIVVLLCATAAGLWSARASAQRPGTVPRSSFAYLVPRDVGVFAEWQPQRQKQRRSSSDGVAGLLRLLAEHEIGRRFAELDYQALLRRNLGMTPEAALEQLFSQRVAVAATTWDRLSEATILLRLKNNDSLDPVIADDRAQLIESRGDLGIFRTASGLWIATNRRVAAFSVVGPDDRLFRDTLKILETNRGSRLGNDPAFAAQVGRLRRDYTAYLYFAEPQGSGSPLSAVVSDVRSGAIGMYARPGRLDFEIRAVVSAPATAKMPVPIDAERMRRLPASTLVAWTASLDPIGAYHRLARSDAAGDARRYLDLAEIVLGADVLEADILSKLGPRLILVWDQGGADSELPQFALMIESSDATSVAATLAQGFATLAELFGGIDGADDETVHVQRGEHLDVEILSVPLTDLLRGERGVAPSVELLASTQPSFAALDGWVLASPHPQALRRLIEADRGWIPRMSSIRELGLHWKRVPERRVSLAVAQPAMASAVLAQWQQGPGEQHSGAKLRKMLGSYRPSIGSVDRPTLGIAIKQGERTGSVRVVRVHAQKPAIGKLKVGDEIVGVDGRLLALDDPVADLRGRIAQCPDPSRLTLRVHRDGQLMEVVVPMPQALPAEPAASPPPDPAEALRRLQSAGRLLSYFNYTVYRSRPQQFHARVSLRFAAEPSEPSTTKAVMPPR